MSLRTRSELRRRSLVKSLLWRFIGILWTWIGAYIILLLVPPSRSSAALIATLIVVYHHSTRMVMYYAYERIWSSVLWGRDEPVRPMSGRDWAVWTIGSIAAIVLVFYLILYVSPKIKGKSPGNSMRRATPSNVLPVSCSAIRR
jgi:magnesium-transporting ATPase (P-type)